MKDCSQLNKLFNKSFQLSVVRLWSKQLSSHGNTEEVKNSVTLRCKYQPTPGHARFAPDANVEQNFNAERSENMLSEVLDPLLFIKRVISLRNYLHVGFFDISPSEKDSLGYSLRDKHIGCSAL